MLDISRITVAAESPLSVDAARLIEKLTQELRVTYADAHEDGTGAFKPEDVMFPATSTSRWVISASPVTTTTPIIR